jgi:hypothetical protein
MRSLYEEGAMDDHEFNKTNTAAEFLDAVAELQKGFTVLQHNITNHSIRVDGDYAEGECYMVVWHWFGSGDDTRVRLLGGRYLDHYSRSTGQWRFTYRKILRDWMHEYAAPALPADAGDGKVGRLDGQDPSYAFFKLFSAGPAQA